MARPADLGHSLGVRQQYLSILSHKAIGGASWTVLGQARVFSPQQNADMRDYKRIGDKNARRVAGVITTQINLTMYVDDNLHEVALALGVPMPGGGWVGNETVSLDPTKKCDFKIENYDGLTTDAVLKYTEYINEFSPGQLTVNLDAEGDVRLAEMNGAAVDYYFIMAAGS